MPKAREKFLMCIERENALGHFPGFLRCCPRVRISENVTDANLFNQQNAALYLQNAAVFLKMQPFFFKMWPFFENAAVMLKGGH